MATYLEEAQALYPQLSPQILDLFAAEWAKSNNPVTAIRAVRQTDEYKTEFPGNYNEATGQVRYDENTYKE